MQSILWAKSTLCVPQTGMPPRALCGKAKMGTVENTVVLNFYVILLRVQSENFGLSPNVAWRQEFVRIFVTREHVTVVLCRNAHKSSTGEYPVTNIIIREIDRMARPMRLVLHLPRSCLTFFSKTYCRLTRHGHNN